MERPALSRRLSAWVGRVMGLAFHADCACGRAVESAWYGERCGRCWARARLDQRLGSPCCGRCGLPLRARAACPDCRVLNPAFDSARAAAAYEGPWRDAILAFKFHDRWAGAGVLARGLKKTLHDGDWDWVAGVPSAPRRERDGKPHLGMELAQAAARHLGLPLRRRGLLRRPGSPRQGELDGEARLKNAAGAFTLGDGIARGGRVLLVDDIMTTGATASACASLLKAAGAARVDVAVLARSR